LRNEDAKGRKPAPAGEVSLFKGGSNKVWFVQIKYSPQGEEAGGEEGNKLAEGGMGDGEMGKNKVESHGSANRLSRQNLAKGSQKIPEVPTCEKGLKDTDDTGARQGKRERESKTPKRKRLHASDTHTCKTCWRGFDHQVDRRCGIGPLNQDRGENT